MTPPPDDLTSVQLAGLEAAIRRQRRLGIGIAVVLGVMTALLLVAGAPRSGPASSRVTLSVVVGAMVALGSVVVSVTLPRTLRRPGPTRRFAVSGSPADIRQVRRQLRSNRPISAEEREIASAIVGATRPNPVMAIGSTIVGVYWLVSALFRNGGDRSFHIVLGVVWLALALGFFDRWRTVRSAAAQGITRDPEHG